MAKIVYRQMPATRELFLQIPPRAKLGCKSPRMGANFWCKSPGMRGGMVVDEIDTCITQSKSDKEGHCFNYVLENGYLSRVLNAIITDKIFMIKIT